MAEKEFDDIGETIHYSIKGFKTIK